MPMEVASARLFAAADASAEPTIVVVFGATSVESPMYASTSGESVARANAPAPEIPIEPEPEIASAWTWRSSAR